LSCFVQPLKFSVFGTRETLEMAKFIRHSILGRKGVEEESAPLNNKISGEWEITKVHKKNLTELVKLMEKNAKTRKGTSLVSTLFLFLFFFFSSLANLVETTICRISHQKYNFSPLL
jgi:hypothetical protein